MDGLIILLGIFLVGLIFALPIVALVSALSARRRAESNRKELEQLAGRLQPLEQQVLRLIKLTSHPEALAAKGASKSEAAPAAAVPEARVPIPPPTAEKPHAPPVRPAEPPQFPPRPEEAARVAPLQAVVPPPQIKSLATPASSVSHTAKSILNIEETLGTNWLNKLGVVILVIGVALFLAYELRQVGPTGKIFVGYLVSLSMLSSGIFFERKDRWRILARAGIGGGWALAFYTTYAMKHVAAARVLESESIDLALLLLVAAAMVAHTLKYHSQTVTGLAFLLAFSTINIGHGGPASLVASALLALGLAVLVVRRSWFELEVFALLAAYLNHFYWLYPIIQRMGPHRHPTPELDASTTLLIFFWLVFRAAYILRRVESSGQENVSTLSALLNTFLFLGLIAYQAARPEMAFRFLLSVGTVELVLSRLPVTRRRRTAFVILSTIGATLVVAAFAYKFSGANLTAVWLLEAEALFVAGVLTREIHFRRLGMLASVALAGQMYFGNVLRLSHLRDQRAYDFSDPRLALLLGLAALVMYANVHWVPARWKTLFDTDFDRLTLRALSYLAGFMALMAIWAISTEAWFAIGLAAVGVAIGLPGRAKKIRELSVQACGFAALSLMRALFVNFRLDCVVHHVSLRLASVPGVIALFYMGARWGGVEDVARGQRVRQAFAWIGSFLAAMLVWYEMDPTAVAPAWTLLGLALFELGMTFRSGFLRWQAYIALFSGFIRIFFVNLNADGAPGQLSPRFYTTVPLIAAYYYVYWRLDSERGSLTDLERKAEAAGAFCYCGTIGLVALARFELPLNLVAAVWAALVVALLAFGRRVQRRIFLHQGLLVSFAVFFRTSLHNFSESSYFASGLWDSRFVWGAVPALLTMASLPMAFRWRILVPAAGLVGRGRLRRAIGAVGRRPEQLLFFIPVILLTLLLKFELPKMVTVAWGVEAVAIFLLALWVGERSYRLTGLGLLLICVGKIIFVDVWRLEPRDRYVTFIVLGVVLLGVSFLYTRYRETLRRFL